MQQPVTNGARANAIAGLRRALYYLDRSFADPRRTGAFTRALATITELCDAEFEDLLARGRLRDLTGIGNSTERVMVEAQEPGEGAYLHDLAGRTVVSAGAGGALRAELRGDLHSHSTWSDGGASIADMAAAAMALGHDYLVMSDHSPRLTIAHGLSVERLAEQVAEIAELNAELAPFRILSGVEVDIYEDGQLDLPDEVLAERDLVVASVHSKLRMEAEEMTHRLVAAVSHPHVDVLGHMTGRMIVGRGRPESTFDADAVLAAAVRHGTAIEINCRPERMDPPDDLLARAVDAGCLFAINSDAHSPGQLEWVSIGCGRAANAGISPDRIINTRAADALVA